MTIKQIISELKETDAKLRDTSLPLELRAPFARIELEDLSIIDDQYRLFSSFFNISKEKMISGEFNYIDYDETTLTFLFFNHVTKALEEQFLSEERKDIISLLASSNSKDEISSMLYQLILKNKLDTEYLKSKCLRDGIDMEISNDNGVYSIWFEINTLDLIPEKRKVKYNSVRQ